MKPEAFAALWIDAYSVATDTGDTRQMRAMSSPQCKTCQALAEQAEDVYGAGGSITANGVTNEVTDYRRSEEYSDNHLLLQLRVKSAAGVTLPKRGAKKIPFEAVDTWWDFELKVVNGKWRVQEAGFTP
ncbi:hypothetical protein BJ980_001063 [Nocardioides daedukensis]|uniref:DUF6318 domain-containing protein n=1 Tax=Nocardioides daedukensis TaxID=634462 RepID=A0A7Y9UVN6_9ACTN|nr:hypothetical protein [Nocardioides daedukensis]